MADCTIKCEPDSYMVVVGVDNAGDAKATAYYEPKSDRRNVYPPVIAPSLVPSIATATEQSSQQVTASGEQSPAEGEQSPASVIATGPASGEQSPASNPPPSIVTVPGLENSSRSGSDTPSMLTSRSGSTSGLGSAGVEGARQLAAEKQRKEGGQLRHHRRVTRRRGASRRYASRRSYRSRSASRRANKRYR